MDTFQTFHEGLGRFKPATSNLFKAAKGLPSPHQKGVNQQRETLRQQYQATKPSLTNIAYILHDEFEDALDQTYQLTGQKGGVPLLVYGDPGIGKSETIRSKAKEFAALENERHPSTNDVGNVIRREFVEWDKTTLDEKKKIMQAPEAYYTLLDVRVAFFTVPSLEGLPEQSEGGGSFDVTPQRFIAYLCNPKTAGMLFLDEINQGSKEVSNILFKVILDRSFQDRRMSDRVTIVAAGNLGKEFGNKSLGPALTARFRAGIIVPDPFAWFKYAAKAGISPEVIGFVRDNPDENFYKSPKNADEPFPNPRSIVGFDMQFKNLQERFEQLVNRGDVPKQTEFQFLNKVHNEARIACGEAWATGFKTYLDYYHTFDPHKTADEVKTSKKANIKRITVILPRKIAEIIDSAIDPSAGGSKFGRDGGTVPGFNAEQLDRDLAPYTRILEALPDEDFVHVFYSVKDIDSPEDNYAITKVLLTYLSKIPGFRDKMKKVYEERVGAK